MAQRHGSGPAANPGAIVRIRMADAHGPDTHQHIGWTNGWNRYLLHFKGLAFSHEAYGLHGVHHGNTLSERLPRSPKTSEVGLLACCWRDLKGNENPGSLSEKVFSYLPGFVGARPPTVRPQTYPPTPDY